MRPAKIPISETPAAISVLSRIAERLDPFDFAPRACMVARLATLGAFHLRPDEYTAVMAAGPWTSVLLANVESSGDVHDGPVWRVGRSYPYDELRTDADWCAICSSVLWDESGGWAVLVSDEGHGVVAGHVETVEEIERHFARPRDDLAETVDRLLLGRPEKREADERIWAMVQRLYGPELEVRLRRRFSDA